MAKVMTVKFLHYPTQAEASSRREWISSLILVSKLSVPRVAQLLNVSKQTVTAFRDNLRPSVKCEAFFQALEDTIMDALVEAGFVTRNIRLVKEDDIRRIVDSLAKGIPVDQVMDIVEEEKAKELAKAERAAAKTARMGEEEKHAPTKLEGDDQESKKGSKKTTKRRGAKA